MLTGIKPYAALAAAAAAIAALIWLADLAGDARELNVTRELQKQEGQTNDSEQKGRARARACHALGPDRLWNVATQTCDTIPL